jgi:hypothetical protein
MIRIVLLLLLSICASAQVRTIIATTKANYPLRSYVDSVVVQELQSPKHISVVYNSGGFIQIYINGVLQTLDATDTGNISTVDLAGYTNATTTFTFFERRTAASTWDFPYYGMYRELIGQKVAWSGSDVLNIMSN